MRVCVPADREPLRDGNELPSYNLGKQDVTCKCENATLTFVSRIIGEMLNSKVVSLLPCYGCLCSI